MSKELGDLVRAVNRRLAGEDVSPVSAEVPSVNDEWFQVVRQPTADLDRVVNAVKERLGNEGHSGFDAFRTPEA